MFALRSLSTISSISVTFLLAWLLVLVLFRCVQRLRARNAVAFFHPQCSGMGGGERVLWCAVVEILKDADVVIYTTPSNAAKKEEILQRVESGFGIPLQQGPGKRTLTFVPVKLFALTNNPRLFPVFTLLLQNLCSILVAVEACVKCPCKIFIESTGFGFALPVAKWLGSTFVATYIHYPTMSFDMISRVQNNVHMYNNQAWISKSVVLTKVKLGYYHLFLLLYGLSGYFADHVWCNSSWTRSRILRIFFKNSNIDLLFPPTDLENLVAAGDKELLSKESPSKTNSITTEGPAVEVAPARNTTTSSTETRNTTSGTTSVGRGTKLPGMKRANRVVSLAQFRIEKDHRLQIEAFAEAWRKKMLPLDACLDMMGSTRNADDEALAGGLEHFVEELGLSDRVKICRNLPFPDVVAKLRSSKVAIHTMRDEHFGITVVEFVAARLLCVCHRSGGPKEDILCTTDLQRQLLAESRTEFAEALGRAFSCYDDATADLDAAIAGLSRFPDNVAFGRAIAGFVAEKMAENVDLTTWRNLFFSSSLTREKTDKQNR
ncbi:unnamed protein product [Amoebophrya sp. A120]|nr:unnamed protein product [Amoebophrya sp. A120]|eukprot:GSA120T00004973001.1